MAIHVKADIFSTLRLLVKSLYPLAKQQQVVLSFKTLQKRLMVVYDPEIIATETITRICREISCTKPGDSVIIKAIIYKQSKKSYLKVTIRIKAQGPTKNSKWINEKTYTALNALDRETIIIDLPLGVNDSPYPIGETGADNNTISQGLEPSFFSRVRLHLQSHFTKSDNLTALLRVDQPKQAAFLQKVHQSIVANIGDEDFDANKLSLLMRMSRAQLFRRLKPLTRQAPAGFIRSIRLTMAKNLLETTDIRVGEVASKTGFKNQSHFAQSFLKKYGFNPSICRLINKNATKK